MTNLFNYYKDMLNDDEYIKSLNLKNTIRNFNTGSYWEPDEIFNLNEYEKEELIYTLIDRVKDAMEITTDSNWIEYFIESTIVDGWLCQGYRDTYSSNIMSWDDVGDLAVTERSYIHWYKLLPVPDDWSKKAPVMY